MKRKVDPEELISLISQGAERARERRESELSDEELALVSAGKTGLPGGTSGLLFREGDERLA